MPFAIGHALIGAAGSKAVIVAPGSTQWANQVVQRLSAGLQTERQHIPPVQLVWESGASDEAAQVAEQVCIAAMVTDEEAIERLQALNHAPDWVGAAVTGLRAASRACGRREWPRQALAEFLERKAALHRAYGRSNARGIPVVTIHGAKNRQFRNVVVLWGPGVPPDHAYQRRLLYNAITRAEQTCAVFVRTQQTLHAPPFA
jgi:superfamily I DNA/RNA helicase